MMRVVLVFLLLASLLCWSATAAAFSRPAERASPNGTPTLTSKPRFWNASPSLYPAFSAIHMHRPHCMHLPGS